MIVDDDDDDDDSKNDLKTLAKTKNDQTIKLSHYDPHNISGVNVISQLISIRNLLTM